MTLTSGVVVVATVLPGALASAAPLSRAPLNVVVQDESTLPASSETLPETTPETTPPTTPETTPPTTPETTPPTTPPTTAPFTCDAVTTTRVPTPGDPRSVVVSDRTLNRYQAVAKTSGPSTRAIQLRLLELGFWLNSVDGKYGLTTSQAVMAFQKYIGVTRTGSVDQTTADALSCARFRSYSSITANWTLVEVDKGRQLLFLVKNGKTVWTINTSTGSGKAYKERNKKDRTKWEIGVAITPSGWHKIYLEFKNGWKEGDLGRIYRPKYVIGGIAIHGMTSVPGYPASHGCIRVSLPGMDMIWKLDWVKRGTSVWIHE